MPALSTAAPVGCAGLFLPAHLLALPAARQGLSVASGGQAVFGMIRDQLDVSA